MFYGAWQLVVGRLCVGRLWARPAIRSHSLHSVRDMPGTGALSLAVKAQGAARCQAHGPARAAKAWCGWFNMFRGRITWGGECLGGTRRIATGICMFAEHKKTPARLTFYALQSVLQA